MAHSVSGRTAYVPGNGNVPPMLLAPFEPRGMAGRRPLSSPGDGRWPHRHRLCNVRFDDRRRTMEGTARALPAYRGVAQAHRRDALANAS